MDRARLCEVVVALRSSVETVVSPVKQQTEQSDTCPMDGRVTHEVYFDASEEFYWCHGCGQWSLEESEARGHVPAQKLIEGRAKPQRPAISRRREESGNRGGDSSGMAPSVWDPAIKHTVWYDPRDSVFWCEGCWQTSVNRTEAHGHCGGSSIYGRYKPEELDGGFDGHSSNQQAAADSKGRDRVSKTAIDRGAEFRVAGMEVSDLADVVARFLEARGFRLVSGDSRRGSYEVGSKTTRVVAGGFARRGKWDVVIESSGDRVRCQVTSSMTGLSGGAVGVARERSQRQDLLSGLDSSLREAVDAPRPRPDVAPGYGGAPESQADVGFKVCPDCAEEVRAPARKCRFCGFRFDDEVPVSTQAQ